MRNVQIKPSTISILQKPSTIAKSSSSSVNISTKKQPARTAAVASKSKTLEAHNKLKYTRPKILIAEVSIKQQPIKSVYEPKPVVQISEKNVMNTIHNVTVISPPTLRKEYSPDTAVVTVEVPIQRERTKTRTLEPDEILVLKQKPAEENKTDVNIQSVVVKEPVAFEINFELPKKPLHATPDQIQPTQDTLVEDDYEEDFESYESDFESCSQSSPVSLASHSSELSSILSDGDLTDENTNVKHLIQGLIRKEDDLDSGTFELKVIEKQIDSIDDRDNHSEGQIDSGFG